MLKGKKHLNQSENKDTGIKNEKKRMIMNSKTTKSEWFILKN